jgi:hypothetical protein
LNGPSWASNDAARRRERFSFRMSRLLRDQIERIAGEERLTVSATMEALLRFLDQPGLEVRFLFGEVRDAVVEATDGKQVPFIYGSLGREPIYLTSARG